MLTLDQLKDEYGEELYRRNPKAILVEYLQHELLDSIFKEKNSKNLSFVGGTAIRIVYHSQRFSEDLDFDNLGLSYAEFEELFKKVIVDMNAKGFIVEFRFVKKGAYHCYIKFPQLLIDNNLTDHASEKILVRIDAVKKKRLFEPEVYLLGKLSVYRHILVNPARIILSQKIITILQRKREKSRDFYDVSYLLGLARPDYDFIKEVHGIEKKELKAKLLKKIDSLSLRRLAQSALPLLVNPSDQDRILSFREYVEQEL
jgi:predicted nucleotidyltransferase component of viral defense system